MPIGEDGIQHLIGSKWLPWSAERLGSAVLQQEITIPNSEDIEMQGRGWGL